MNIQELIGQAGKHLRSEFENIKNSNPHFAERGAEAEIILSNFLNQHLPKRFAAGSGLIVDHRNNISSQTDVIIYDAENSPIYRKGDRVLILPCDNVASVIEVKSNLNKQELEDAARKIASVKKLEKAPITDIDQPVTFSPLITTKTLGIVFAYESSTSLETLAENLRDINREVSSDEWIDLVVVLDKGVIGYLVQLPFSQELPGWFGGAASKDFLIPPFYVHLAKEDLGEFTLNRFFANLMAHLTFYRKRSTLVFESVMGNHPRQCMVLQGYQYDLKRNLVPAEEAHQGGNLLKSLIKFNLYSTQDGIFVGQIARMPWQDGAVLSYSGRLGPPQIFFAPYFRASKSQGICIQGMKDANLWLSSVIPLSKEKFREVSEQIKGQVVARYYEGDEDTEDFPKTLEEYDKLEEKRGSAKN